MKEALYLGHVSYLGHVKKKYPTVSQSHPMIMRRRELSKLICEYNLACKGKPQEEGVCDLCWHIAGQVLTAIGLELTAAGVVSKKDI